MSLPILEEGVLHINDPGCVAVLDTLSGSDYLPTHQDNYDVFFSWQPFLFRCSTRLVEYTCFLF